MYIIFDVGATNIKYCVIDETYDVLITDKVKTPRTNIEEFSDAFMNVIEEYKDRIELQGIGVCLPGRVNEKTGMIIDGGRLEFLNGKSIYEIIKVDEKVKINIENDAKSAALGEQWWGNLKGVQNGMVLTLGTGLGGGLILNGKLFRGSSNEAGEISFVHLGYDKGSINRESLAYRGSAVQLVDLMKELVGNKNLHGEEVFEILKEGSNTELNKIFNDYIVDIAHQIVNLQCILDLEKIVIGGGISNQDIVIDELQKTVHQIVDQNEWLRNYPVVQRTYFGNNANLMGLICKLEEERNL